MNHFSAQNELEQIFSALIHENQDKPDRSMQMEHMISRFSFQNSQNNSHLSLMYPSCDERVTQSIRWKLSVRHN